MEYNTCKDLCLQVVWAYIQPSSLESLAQNLYRNTEKECNSETVHKELKRLIKEGRTDLKPLKKLLGKFENDKYITDVRDMCNYIKHRGTIHFDGLGDNLDKMLLTVNGQVVRSLGRPSYTFNEVEDILWNYHKTFQEYFNQIIDRVSSNLADDAELVGWAMCQGKMGPAVKQRYEAMLEQEPENARFKMLLDNWVAAKDHPTKEDLDNMAAAAKKAVLGE